MIDEIFIPECFNLAPEAAEVIRSTWHAAEYRQALAYLEEKFFAAEVPESADKLPWKGDEAGKLLLTAAVAYYPSAVKLYQERKWPLELLQDTMDDFRVWSQHHYDNFGTWGLIWDGAAFIRSQMHGFVVRFGRLQCNTIYPLWKELCTPDGKVILPKGTQVINLHIPASGALNIDESLKSMEKMKEFFRIYRPEIEWRAFVCHSWLLDVQLRKLLPETSNIIKFQKLGMIIDEPEKQADTVFRVFGVKAVKDGVASIPWTTSMQKILGKFILDGGEFHPGWMIIPR